MENDVEPKKCVVCGEDLPPGAIGHVSTHEGDCREKHSKDMMDQVNSRIKKQRIEEIFSFLEKRFGLGIDIDGFSGAILPINLYNISIDDFAMTAYYVWSMSDENSGITIADVENVAVEWDEINGSPRVERYRKVIESRIATIEKAIASVKDDVQMKKMENKLKKCRRMLDQRPRIGFNRNAYALLQSSLDIVFCDVHEKIKSMASRIADDHSYGENFKELMSKKYDGVREKVLGRSPKVIVAGLLYSTAVDLDYTVTPDDVSSMTGVSKSSIEEIHDEMQS